VLVQALPLCQHLIAPSVDGGVDTCGMGSTSPHTCSIDPCVGVQATIHLRSNENYALGPMS